MVHMSPFSSDFVSISPVSSCSISGVNGSVVAAHGIGNILLRSEGSGTTLILQHTLYVPDAAVQLVSITCLIEDLPGSILFNDNQATIFYKNRDIIATGF